MVEVIFSVARTRYFVWIHLSLKTLCGGCLTLLGKTWLQASQICRKNIKFRGSVLMWQRGFPFTDVWVVEFKDVAERWLCLLWLYLWNLQLFGAHKSRGAILILHKVLHGRARVLSLVSNQSSCHSPTQRQAANQLALICSPINVSILQYGVVRHIDDELLIVVPESDSDTDPKKQVWSQQFFSLLIKGAH